MKMLKVWLPAVIIVIVVSSAVGVWQRKLLLGSLSKNPVEPVIMQTHPAAKETEENIRICSPAEFIVSTSPFSPTERIEIDEITTILARFIVTTQNCSLPITSAWLRWYPADLHREKYHVILSKPVFYPYARDLKLIYRYTSYDKPLCIGAPLSIFDVLVDSENFHLIPVKNVTTVPPNSAQEFIIRGDLLIDKNDFILPEGISQNEPEYRITAGVFANIHPLVYGETAFIPRKFKFEGLPVEDYQIFDNCR